jgi:hypothetical protein
MTMNDTTATWMMLGLDGAMLLHAFLILRLAGVPMRLTAPAVGLGALWLVPLTITLEGGFLPETIPGPAFLAIIFAGVGAFAALFTLTPARRIVRHLSQGDLMRLQGIRVFFGAGFLIQTAYGQLPPLFGTVDGILHVVAGFLGLFAATLYDQHGDNPSRAARRASWVANVWGLCDILFVAATLALVLLPQLTLDHAMMYAVFLPAPIWLLAHVVSIRRALAGAPIGLVDEPATAAA